MPLNSSCQVNSHTVSPTICVNGKKNASRADLGVANGGDGGAQRDGAEEEDGEGERHELCNQFKTP